MKQRIKTFMHMYIFMLMILYCMSICSCSCPGIWTSVFCTLFSRTCFISRQNQGSVLVFCSRCQLPYMSAQGTPTEFVTTYKYFGFSLKLHIDLIKYIARKLLLAATLSCLSWTMGMFCSWTPHLTLFICRTLSIMEVWACQPITQHCTFFFFRKLLHWYNFIYKSILGLLIHLHVT